MEDGFDPFRDRVIYEKPTWFDRCVDIALMLIVFPQVVVSLFVFIFGILIREAFREPDAKLPREIIDDAFTVLEDRMKVHGFVREGRKRQLVRTEDRRTDRIGYAARRYNERGLTAEFSIWLSKTAPPPPIQIPWRSGALVVVDEKTGILTVEVDIHSLSLIPTVFPYINLYPRFLRTWRVQAAANMVERRALPWLSSDRLSAFK